MKFSMREIEKVMKYVHQNPEINEILFTGGDPLIMSPATISKYFDVILAERPANLKNIRFGSKSLSYWPFAFLPQFSDEGREMLNLFKRITDNGFHLSFMAHFNHLKNPVNFCQRNSEVIIRSGFTFNEHVIRYQT